MVSMFLIIMGHYFFHNTAASIDSIYADMMRTYSGYVGVCCFVMISGYCMIHSKLTLPKMLRLWFTVFFYSVSICVLMPLLAHHGAISLGILLHYGLPISMYVYWFVSLYVVLMMLSPFLNRFLLSLSNRDMLVFILVLLIVTLMLQVWGGKLILFVLLYSMGAYLRLWGERLHELSPGKWFLMAGTLVTVLGPLACGRLPMLTLGSFALNLNKLFDSAFTHLLVVFIALCVFMGCASWRIGKIQWINYLASCVFAVYLIHDHDFLRGYIWNRWVGSIETNNTLLMIARSVGVCFLVYVGCTLIEILRQQTVGRLYEWCAPRWILPPICGVWSRVKRWVDKAAGD